MDAIFSVITYNMGTNLRDFHQLCSFYSQETSAPSEEEYQRIQDETTKLLLAQSVDVYCLQEVGSMDRPLIQELQKRNFQIITKKSGRNLGTAIAINPNRFTDIKPYADTVAALGGTPTVSDDVALALATDRATGQNVAFVSTWPAGFPLDGRKITTDLTDIGDQYCESVARFLSVLASDRLQIIGADMNANPEAWKPRFDVFTSSGLEILRTNTPTNVNPNDPQEYMKREIDFVFFKSFVATCSRIKSFFCRTVESHQATIAPFPGIGFDPAQNASDHIPLITTVTTKMRPSTISWLFWSIIGLLRRPFV